jgi:hypothetical protein
LVLTVFQYCRCSPRGRARATSESLPISLITQEVTDLGHIFLPINDDGIVHSVFLKTGFSQAHWPALSLAALQTLGDMPTELAGLAKSHEGQVGQGVGSACSRCGSSRYYFRRSAGSGSSDQSSCQYEYCRGPRPVAFDAIAVLTYDSSVGVCICCGRSWLPSTFKLSSLKVWAPLVRAAHGECSGID